MPKTTFSNDERAAAKVNGAVLFNFTVDGGAASDFAYGEFRRGGPLHPAQAEDLIETVQAKLKSFRETPS